eukprot:GILJ01009002.1.p1 GENE.GILJ01009002.1~~GILJ01009002.1.p1  ORF type:complete len:166 (+),score=13.65 GILJ01009002.1:1302-1799(+)
MQASATPTLPAPLRPSLCTPCRVLWGSQRSSFSSRLVLPKSEVTQRNSMPKHLAAEKSNKATVVRLGRVIRGYELMAELDKGTFTQTFKLRKVITGELFALKMALHFNIEREEHNLHGVLSLSNLHHENIVRFIEAFPYEASTDRQMVVPTGLNGLGRMNGFSVS